MVKLPLFFNSFQFLGEFGSYLTKYRTVAGNKLLFESHRLMDNQDGHLNGQWFR